MGEDSEGWPSVSQDHIKKHAKKRENIQQKGRGTTYMALFTFTSVVQILDYVDKKHMNTHYFHCSDLNKLIIIIIITIIIIIIIIAIIIKHYTYFSDGSVNKESKKKSVKKY